MKDYRTWWRKGINVNAGIFTPPDLKLCDSIEDNDAMNDDDEFDCVCEQLWAIREDLA